MAILNYFLQMDKEKDTCGETVLDNCSQDLNNSNAIKG